MGLDSSPSKLILITYQFSLDTLMGLVGLKCQSFGIDDTMQNRGLPKFW